MPAFRVVAFRLPGGNCSKPAVVDSSIAPFHSVDSNFCELRAPVRHAEGTAGDVADAAFGPQNARALREWLAAVMATASAASDCVDFRSTTNARLHSDLECTPLSMMLNDRA